MRNINLVFFYYENLYLQASEIAQVCCRNLTTLAQAPEPMVERRRNLMEVILYLPLVPPPHHRPHSSYFMGVGVLLAYMFLHHVHVVSKEID